MGSYVIGIDFGSLSGRGILVDASSGKTIASQTMVYTHAVMDHSLPDGTVLPPNWALQHPQDFLDVLSFILPKLASQVDSNEIRGIGIDCTSSSVLPVYSDGTPLCLTKEYEHNPYSYIMMWKHHGGQPYADLMTEAAKKRDEPWLKRCGSIINAEWLFPKLMQLCIEAPDVYNAAAYEVDMPDWLVWQLTGQLTRSEGCLGYKAFWYNGHFPSDDYFTSLDHRMHACTAKLKGTPVPLGSCAGYVSESVAARYGIPAGIPVSAGNIDAHVCIAASGITNPGDMLGIIGTSSVYVVMSEEEQSVPGISGMVHDGLLPGYVGFEAGQSCVGDCLAWYCENCVPEAVSSRANAEGLSVQAYLTRLASALKPCQSGLIALDWFNGNRSILADSDLTGTILGLNLQTKPEEIYRALIESTAFGAKVILENFRNHGVSVRHLYASGGIPAKNTLMMQIYSDILNLPIHIVPAEQGGALGSAVMAASASGIYPTVSEAVKAMSPECTKIFNPLPENVEAYGKLWTEYKYLHDLFGDKPSIMHRLKKLKNNYSKEDIPQ